MSSSPRTLFGTDGIRGKAGLKPLDPESVMRLGMAAADVLLPGFRREATHRWPSVVIGKDTRLSGDMLEAAIAAGLNARGIDVRLAGVVPTPAVAWLTRETGAAFGVVISASHNPFDDNGIKFFDWRGIKLDDKTEAAIEAAFKGEIDPKAAEIGRTAPIEDAAERYVHFVCGLFQDHRDLFTGSRFALDAANGAASVTSAAILTHLGAKVSVFHDRPNGMNINRECGCTHPEAIESLVRETGADAGISHDGDADRVMLCDETGSSLDGDELLAIAGLDLLNRGELNQATVVGTLMSNAGLEACLAERGGRLVRAGVGDRYVMREMLANDYNFGGEQSGHLIFRDLNPTGDGIVAAVRLLEISRRTGKPLSEMRRVLKKFPQTQRNLRVKAKPPLETVPTVSAVIEAANRTLGNQGRVLVRYSGTESLLRVLVEGRDDLPIDALADEIASAVGAEIGA